MYKNPASQRTLTANFSGQILNDQDLLNNTDLIIKGKVLKIKEEGRNIFVSTGSSIEMSYILYEVEIHNTIKTPDNGLKKVDVFVPEIVDIPELIPGNQYILSLFKKNVKVKENEKIKPIVSYSLVSTSVGNYIYNSDSNTVSDLRPKEDGVLQTENYDDFVNRLNQLQKQEFIMTMK